MSGHNIAVESIKEWSKNSNQPLTESDIRSLHTMILVKPFWSAAVTEIGIKTTKEIKVGGYKNPSK